MFKKITPEEAGVSSAHVADYISVLKRRGFAIHNIIMMKGDKIFAEYYWKPFHKDFLHRMYSQTKTHAAIAIGFLEQEGKLSLDDKLVDIFRDKITTPIPESLEKQTIREMLTMTTVNGHRWWMDHPGENDRTAMYLNNRSLNTRPASTLWNYDTDGSYMLGAVAERVSGMPLFDFLYDRLYKKLGAFENAYMLLSRDDVAWGDSGLISTPRDMLAFARFVMNYGKWNGEQILNEKFLRDATSKLVDNRSTAHNQYMNMGYGYQIWRGERNSFSFRGMGMQDTLCFPDQDIILLINSDIQYNAAARPIVYTSFVDLLIDKVSSTPLPKDPEAEARLAKETENLELVSVQGLEDSPYREIINGKVYKLDPNPMGITKMSFHFNDAKTGEIRYTNEQGDKVLPFGVNHNIYGKFPQLGYAGLHGCVPTTDGMMYDDAVSLAWTEENRVLVFIQIIDQYYGNMSWTIGFRDGRIAMEMYKNGEYFLNEYQGRAVGDLAE